MLIEKDFNVKPRNTAMTIRSQNIVNLTGKLLEMEEVTELHGYPFEGSIAKVEVARLSNTVDEVIVAFKSKAAKSEIAPGDTIAITGKIQTLRNAAGKTLVFVLAQTITVSTACTVRNEIVLTGKLVRSPQCRVTPRGIHVSDLLIEIPCTISKSSCVVPCICWNSNADKVTNWKEGDAVRITGRYQSRLYSKLVNDDTRQYEYRIAREVSVSRVNRVQSIGGYPDDTEVITQDVEYNEMFKVPIERTEFRKVCDESSKGADEDIQILWVDYRRNLGYAIGNKCGTITFYKIGKKETWTNFSKYVSRRRR